MELRKTGALVLAAFVFLTACNQDGKKVTTEHVETTESSHKAKSAGATFGAEVKLDADGEVKKDDKSN